MKTVYEVLINGRLYTGTMDEIKKEVGFSDKHIRRIGEVNKIGYLLPEYKVIGKRNKKLVTGHVYDIARSLRIKPESVRGYYPSPTGKMKFISKNDYEIASNKDTSRFKELSIGDVRMIVGRMKYLNKNGAKPKWKPTAPMMKELKDYGLTYGEIKEVKC